MSTSSSSKQPSEPTPVLTLIKQIKDGQVQPKSIGADDRRRCVEVLRTEGYTLAEIGQILKGPSTVTSSRIVRTTHCLLIRRCRNG